MSTPVMSTVPNCLLLKCLLCLEVDILECIKGYSMYVWHLSWGVFIRFPDICAFCCHHTRKFSCSISPLYRWRRKRIHHIAWNLHTCHLHSCRIRSRELRHLGVVVCTVWVAFCRKFTIGWLVLPFVLELMLVLFWLCLWNPVLVLHEVSCVSARCSLDVC